jgi:hypothetical protein
LLQQKLAAGVWRHAQHDDVGGAADFARCGCMHSDRVKAAGEPQHQHQRTAYQAAHCSPCVILRTASCRELRVLHVVLD